MSELIEEWRDIPGYVGCYQVSSIGNVRSVSRPKRNRNAQWIAEGRPKKLTMSYGRPVTSLCKDGVSKVWHIHQLVALAFIGPPNGLSVNHIDGVKANNRAENLEYLSLRDNSLHQYHNGLSVIPLGSHNGKSRLKEEDIPYIRALRRNTRMTSKEIGERYGVTAGTIAAVLEGRTWSHVL